MLTVPQRNRYFRGKLLDAHHFELEQCYFNRKRWLLNRLGLGNGVLYGLDVVEANGGLLRVQPGLAIDAFGREIIVDQPSEPFDPRSLTDPNGNPTEQRLGGGGTVSISLVYRECETEPVPVLDGGCGSEVVCAPSTLEERYAVVVAKHEVPAIQPENHTVIIPGNTVGVAAAAKQIVQGLRAAPADPTRSGLTSILPPTLSVLKPAFPTIVEAPTEPPGVLLARVVLSNTNAPPAIHNDIRHELKSNDMLLDSLLPLLPLLELVPFVAKVGFSLTTIEKVSWTHGKDMSIEDLVGGKNPGLEITFSQALDPLPEDNGWYSVTVEYPVSSAASGGATRKKVAIPHRESDLPAGTFITQRAIFTPTLSSDRKVLVLTPHPSFVATFRQTCHKAGCMPDKAGDSQDEEGGRQQGALCRIAINCNCLVDKYGQLVDGDYLGKLPSGDGLQGGTFESWFTLRPKAGPSIL